MSSNTCRLITLTTGWLLTAGCTHQLISKGDPYFPGFHRSQPASGTTRAIVDREPPRTTIKPPAPEEADQAANTAGETAPYHYRYPYRYADPYLHYLSD